MAVLGRRARSADDAAVIDRERVNIAAFCIERDLRRLDGAGIGDVAAAGLDQDRVVAAGLQQYASSPAASVALPLAALIVPLLETDLPTRTTSPLPDVMEP